MLNVSNPKLWFHFWNTVSNWRHTKRKFASLALSLPCREYTYFLVFRPFSSCFCSCPKHHSSVLDSHSLWSNAPCPISHTNPVLLTWPNFFIENHSVSSQSQSSCPRNFFSFIPLLSQFSKSCLSTLLWLSRQLPHNSGHFLLHTARVINASQLCQISSLPDSKSHHSQAWPSSPRSRSQRCLKTCAVAKLGWILMGD